MGGVDVRLAYADPPYPGQSKKHYGTHPDYDGEVDHRSLCEHLWWDFDGFVLHTSVPALGNVLRWVEETRQSFGESYRVCAWVKPFAAFKANVPVAYAWEPVIVRAARKPVVSKRLTLRDWIAEPMTMHRGLTGAKPDAVCRWAFECMGASRADDLVDLFPGTGAVGRAWEAWRGQLSLLDHDPSLAPAGRPSQEDL